MPNPASHRRMAAIRAAFTPRNSIIGFALLAAMVAVSSLMVRASRQHDPTSASTGGSASAKPPSAPVIPTAEVPLPPQPSDAATPSPTDTPPAPVDGSAGPAEPSPTPMDSPTTPDSHSPTTADSTPAPPAPTS
jgi:hypothetical protein